MMTSIVNTAAGGSAEGLETTHWERVAESTTWGRYISDVERQVILRGASLAGEPGHAVDLGCGGGRWSRELATRGWNLTCLDVSRSALAVCQRNVPTAKCVLTHAVDKSLSLPSHSAQLALCVEVIPLIESTWFLAEVRRVLSDRGILVGVYINGKSLRGLAWRVKRRLLNSHDGPQFYNSSYSEFKRGLNENGLELLHEESCCWGPFTRDSNSPFVPACARMERALGLHRVVTWSPWVVFIARKTTAA
jgi:SAM-dependent methyltransferase